MAWSHWPGIVGLPCKPCLGTPLPYFVLAITANLRPRPRSSLSHATCAYQIGPPHLDDPRAPGLAVDWLSRNLIMSAATRHRWNRPSTDRQQKVGKFPGAKFQWRGMGIFFYHLVLPIRCKFGAGRSPSCDRQGILPFVSTFLRPACSLFLQPMKRTAAVWQRHWKRNRGAHVPKHPNQANHFLDDGCGLRTPVSQTHAQALCNRPAPCATHDSRRLFAGNCRPGKPHGVTIMTKAVPPLEKVEIGRPSLVCTCHASPYPRDPSKTCQYFGCKYALESLLALWAKQELLRYVSRTGP